MVTELGTIELSCSLWIDEPNLDNLVWDSEIVQTTLVGTIDKEPRSMITTVTIPDDQESQFSVYHVTQSL